MTKFNLTGNTRQIITILEQLLIGWVLYSPRPYITLNTQLYFSLVALQLVNIQLIIGGNNEVIPRVSVICNSVLNGYYYYIDSEKN